MLIRLTTPTIINDCNTNYPLLPSFLHQNSLDLIMKSDALTLLALRCLKSTNNTAKSNHVSSPFLISYVLFHIYFSTCTNFFESLIFFSSIRSKSYNVFVLHCFFFGSFLLQDIKRCF